MPTLEHQSSEPYPADPQDRTSQTESGSDQEAEEPPRADISACLPGFSYEDAFMCRERAFALHGQEQLRVLQRFMELDGTAGTVWPVTEVFMREYQSLTDRALWNASGKSVLELGSGTGVLAMFLAAHHATGVVATDVGDGLDLLRTNFMLRENVAALGESHDVLHSAQLRWDEQAVEDLAMIRDICFTARLELDTLVVFDALYNQDALEPLSEVIKKVCIHFETLRSLLVGYQDRQPEVEARGLQMLQESFAGISELRVRRLFDIAPVHAVILEKI